MPFINDNAKKEFQAKLSGAAAIHEASGANEYSEKYFILARMLHNLDVTSSLLKPSPDDIQFERDAWNDYHLTTKSQQLSEQIKKRLQEDDLLDKLANKIAESVEQSSYPEWRRTEPQALLESFFYQQYAQAARELFEIKEHDMGRHIVFRGIPLKALSEDEVNSFFSKPHRGTAYAKETKGLMDYQISTYKRPSLYVKNVTNRATNATSMTLSPDVAFDYATQGFLDDEGKKRGMNNGWIIIARAGKGVNPQLTQNRWYSEITMDEIPPEDILALCKVSTISQSDGKYTVHETHYNPNLDKAAIKQEINTLSWLEPGSAVKKLTRNEREAEILANPLSKRLLLGGPLLDVDSHPTAFEALPPSPEETLMYQLLQDVLVYVVARQLSLPVDDNYLCRSSTKELVTFASFN